MRYLIGIDIGTSATKTVLFDERCHVVTSASQEYPLYQPQNGWAEQEPLDWYNAVLVTIRKVVKDSGVASEDIKGIGLSGQMHGLVMLDEKNEVIRPSIIWCDQRTGKECEEITERVGRKRLIEITANPALTGFTASKILWVRNHEAENYRRCRHILLPKDYIRFRMTGEYATEVSDASGMQLLAQDEEAPAKTVSAVSEAAELFIPLGDLVDVAKETARLTKERDSVQRDIERGEAKLNNPGFTGKAPAQLVEQEREKLAVARDKLAKLNARIEDLAHGVDLLHVLLDDLANM